MLVMTKPPSVIYSNIKSKIGSPKDYQENVKEKVFDSGCPEAKTAIPQEILSKHAMDNGDELIENETDDGGEDGRYKHASASQQEYYTPIKALSTFIYDWRIKARLTKKGARKTYKNARSEGYFLNIELMDSFGTMIQATFFKDACDKYEPIMKEGGIYLFSNGNVKLANQRFATVKNDFCIVFDKNADI